MSFFLRGGRRKPATLSLESVSSLSLSHVSCNTVVAVFSNCAKLPASVFTALRV